MATALYNYSIALLSLTKLSFCIPLHFLWLFLLSLYSFSRNVFSRIKLHQLKEFYANFSKTHLKGIYFRESHVVPEAMRPKYIIVEIYHGQKDWIHWTFANFHLTGKGGGRFGKFFPSFSKEKINFLNNYLIKIFEIFTRDL